MCVASMSLSQTPEFKFSPFLLFCVSVLCQNALLATCGVIFHIRLQMVQISKQDQNGKQRIQTVNPNPVVMVWPQIDVNSITISRSQIQAKNGTNSEERLGETKLGFGFALRFGKTNTSSEQPFLILSQSGRI